LSPSLSILGAGLGGTCLALRLSEARYKGPIVIHDSRREFETGRHWCFWGTVPRYLKPFVNHTWHEIEVRDANQVIRRRTPDIPYVHLEGGRFLEEAHRRLRRLPNVEFRLGEAPVPEADGYVVDTIEREPVAPVLYRRYVSRLVRHGGRDVQRAVRLLDFRVDSEGSDERPDFGFAQIMPLGPQEAYVVLTHYSISPAGLAQDERALDAYVGREFSDVRRVISLESRVLPLGSVAAEAVDDRRRVVLTGDARLAASLAMPRVLSEVDRVARAIEKGKPLRQGRSPALTQWLDRTFIEAAIECPLDASAGLVSLFRRLQGDSLSRLLMDQATWGDLAAVASAIPPSCFVRSALRNWLVPARTVLRQGRPV